MTIDQYHVLIHIAATLYMVYPVPPALIVACILNIHRCISNCLIVPKYLPTYCPWTKNISCKIILYAYYKFDATA